MPVYSNPAMSVPQQMPQDQSGLIGQQSSQAPGESQSIQNPNLQSQDDMIVKALIDRLKFNQKGSQQQAELAMGGGSGKQGYVSYKIPKLINEGYPQKQAAAIAYSMAKQRGMGGGGDMCAKCMKSHPGMECEMEQGGGGYQLPRYY